MLNEAVGHQVDVNGEKLLQTEVGVEGHAVFGPYERRERGRYVAVFTIELNDDITGLENRICAAVDVSSDVGKMSYGRKLVTVADLAGGPKAIALPFEVHDPANFFEYRIWVNGEVSLLIAEQVDVFALSAPLPEKRPQRGGFPRQGAGPLPHALIWHEDRFRKLYEKGADFIIDGTTITAVANGKSADATDGDAARIANQLWRYGFAVEVNYADVREDVILLQALRDVPREEGFYIDVGANDPVVGSVTKLFYDRGWRGINVDASPRWHARLVEERTRDINIQAAVSDVPGEIGFFDDAVNGLGTIEKKFADRHLAERNVVTEHMLVKTQTLASICEQHAPRTIHFLKVDVEGHEGPVLRSMDFGRFRPWVLCIEATEPMNISAKTFQDWDRIVVKAGYILAFADHLNRYYVASERDYLRARFATLPENQVKLGWSL